MLKLIITGKTAQELSEQLADVVAEFTQGQQVNKPVMQVIPHRPAVENPLETPKPSYRDIQKGPEIIQVNQELPRRTESAVAERVSSSDVDSRGLPWDSRIHSSSKEKTTKGHWRYRRGVKDPEIDAVEAQLRGSPSHGLMAQPIPAAIPSPAPSQVQQASFAPPVIPHQFVGQPVAPQSPVSYVPPQVVPQVQAVFNPPQQAVVQVTPALPPMPGTRPAHDFASFKETLIPTVARLIEDKKITQDYLNQVLSYFKVKQLWDMNDQQIAEFLNTLAAAELVIKVGG